MKINAKQILKKVEKQMEFERVLFSSLLEVCKWDREKARKKLKMSRASFYRTLKELKLTKLTPKEWRKL